MSSIAAAAMNDGTTSCSKSVFSVIDDEKLIESVAKFPCLYDLANGQYKNQEIKDSAWNEIAGCINKSAEECKKRWRNIKDTYFKRMRKGKSTTGSSASNKSKPWPLAEMLSFLGNVEHKRQTIASVGMNTEKTVDVEDDTASVIEQSTCEKADESIDRASQNLPKIEIGKNKRRKRDDKILEMMVDRRNDRLELMKSLNQNNDDDIDLFFKSIASSVKKLKPELINEAKMKSLQMVFDLESRNNIFSYASSSTNSSGLYDYAATPPQSTQMSFDEAANMGYQNL